MWKLSSELKGKINGMKVIIDRFEGEFAVVELPDGNMANMPKCLLEKASEGDVVDISVDEGETEKRKKRVSSLMNDLFQ